MSRSIANKQTGRFISIPFVVLKSNDYRNLKPYAAKLLNLMLMQYNGNNNGDLSAAWSTMSVYGFKSKGTLQRSLNALLEADLIRKTRESYFQHPNNKCALYCVTWRSIDECPEKRLDMKATTTPPRKFSMEKTQSPVPKRDRVRPQNSTGEITSDLETGLSKNASALKTDAERPSA